MRTRRLGSRGPEISVVGFGTWAVAGPWGWGWGPVDDAESIAAVRRAVESGVSWVDTAPVYGLGSAEELVGRALRSFEAGAEVLVFTKCGVRQGSSGDLENDLRPESIRLECEQSLRRLGRERIDLYQLHWPDRATGTPLEESWGTMAELADEGKVRWIGVSNFDVAQLERCEAIRHVDSLQPPLSLLERGARGDVIPWCTERGTGVIVYSPLESGLLTGSFDRERLERLPEDDFRRGRPRFFAEPRLSRALELVERLRPIAEWLDVSFPALALAWTLAVSGVTGAIAGARRPEQVDGWLAAGKLELDPETLEEIEELFAETEAGTDAPQRPVQAGPRLWLAETAE